MRAGLLLTIALWSACASGQPQSEPQSVVVVGGERFVLPPPKGFMRVTASHARVMQRAQLATFPTNRLVAVFALEKQLEGITLGYESSLDRYHLVQVSQQRESRTASPADFDRVRSVIRNQMDEVFRKVEPRVAEITRRLERQLSEDAREPVTIRSGESVPIRIFNESPVSFAFGTLSRMEYREGSTVDDYVLASIASAVLVRGKMLYVYTYATVRTEGDTEWAKRASVAWA